MNTVERWYAFLRSIKNPTLRKMFANSIYPAMPIGEFRFYDPVEDPAKQNKNTQILQIEYKNGNH